MGATKSAVGSLTIWSAVVILAAQGLQAVGYTISADDQAAIANLINSGILTGTTIISMVGAIGAIIGRIRASKQITTVVPAKAIIFALAICASGVSLSSCQLPQPVQSPAAAAVVPAPAAASLTPSTVCRDIAAVQAAPDAVALLESQDPHSTLGVIWAQAKSSCAGGVPLAGIDATWRQQVWQMFLNAAPVVLPKLAALLLAI
jgi:hypothetical protein